MPSSSWTSVLSVWMGVRMLKGGESGATGPTMEAEGVGWCSVRIGLLSCVDASIEVDEGMTRDLSEVTASAAVWSQTVGD